MKKEVKKCAALIGAVSMLGTTLYAIPANAAESAVRDFRVTDAYTGLSYGSVNSEVLQYTGTDSGVVLSDNGAEINTENDFSLQTREDILDGLAAAANGRAVEFTMTAGVQSCESLALTVTDGTRETTLYQADTVQGENEFSVIYTGKSAMLTVNDTVINSVACSSVPVVTLSGTDADMTISDVNYSIMAASEETEEEAVILADMNAAADSDAMETALTAYLEHAGKASVYTSLPDCDTVNIKERLLAAKPFSTYADVVSGYQSALEAATRVDTTVYNQVFVEDFNGGADESWTATNLASNAIGNGKVLGNVRQSLAITDEQYSFAVFGGSLKASKPNYEERPNYIEREIANPQSIVTLYMRVINNNALSFSVTFDGSNGIGLKNTGTACHTIVNNDAKSKTSASFATDKWNKIVLDGTESGKVKCYVNNTLAATFDSTITKLNVGTIFDFDSYSVIEIDNISIAEEKSAAEVLAEFNASSVTQSSINKIIGRLNKSDDLFNALPECDRSEVVQRLEQDRPYAELDTLKSAYQTALEYTTQADWTQYDKVWQEDFSAGLDETKWTVTGALKNRSVGSEEMFDSTLPRQNLNISGTETASAGFVGASFVSGKLNYITRDITDENTRITLYFYDTMYSDTAFF